MPTINEIISIDITATPLIEQQKGWGYPLLIGAQQSGCDEQYNGDADLRNILTIYRSADDVKNDHGFGLLYFAALSCFTQGIKQLYIYALSPDADNVINPTYSDLNAALNGSGIHSEDTIGSNVKNGNISGICFVGEDNLLLYSALKTFCNANNVIFIAARYLAEQTQAAVDSLYSTSNYYMRSDNCFFITLPALSNEFNVGAAALGAIMLHKPWDDIQLSEIVLHNSVGLITSRSLIDYVETKNMNTIIEIDGVNYFSNNLMFDAAFADTQRTKNHIIHKIQAVLNDMVTTNGILTYDRCGLSLLETSLCVVMESLLKEGVVTNYNVVVPDLSEIDDTDIATGILNGVVVSCNLINSIQSFDINFCFADTSPDSVGTGNELAEDGLSDYVLPPKVATVAAKLAFTESTTVSTSVTSTPEPDAIIDTTVINNIEDSFSCLTDTEMIPGYDYTMLPAGCKIQYNESIPNPGDVARWVWVVSVPHLDTYPVGNIWHIQAFHCYFGQSSYIRIECKEDGSLKWKYIFNGDSGGSSYSTSVKYTSDNPFTVELLCDITNHNFTLFINGIKIFTYHNVVDIAGGYTIGFESPDTTETYLHSFAYIPEMTFSETLDEITIDNWIANKPEGFSYDGDNDSVIIEPLAAHDNTITVKRKNTEIMGNVIHYAFSLYDVSEGNIGDSFIIIFNAASPNLTDGVGVVFEFLGSEMWIIKRYNKGIIEEFGNTLDFFLSSYDFWVTALQFPDHVLCHTISNKLVKIYHPMTTDGYTGIIASKNGANTRRYILKSFQYNAQEFVGLRNNETSHDEVCFSDGALTDEKKTSLYKMVRYDLPSNTDYDAVNNCYYGGEVCIPLNFHTANIKFDGSFEISTSNSVYCEHWVISFYRFSSNPNQLEIEITDFFDDLISGVDAVAIDYTDGFVPIEIDIQLNRIKVWVNDVLVQDTDIIAESNIPRNSQYAMEYDTTYRGVGWWMSSNCKLKNIQIRGIPLLQELVTRGIQSGEFESSVGFPVGCTSLMDNFAENSLAVWDCDNNPVWNEFDEAVYLTDENMAIFSPIKFKDGFYQLHVELGTGGETFYVCLHGTTRDVDPEVGEHYTIQFSDFRTYLTKKLLSSEASTYLHHFYDDYPPVEPRKIKISILYYNRAIWIWRDDEPILYYKDFPAISSDPGYFGIGKMGMEFHTSSPGNEFVKVNKIQINAISELSSDALLTLSSQGMAGNIPSLGDALLFESSLNDIPQSTVQGEIELYSRGNQTLTLTSTNGSNDAPIMDISGENVWLLHPDINTSTITKTVNTTTDDEGDVLLWTLKQSDITEPGFFILKNYDFTIP